MSLLRVVTWLEVALLVSLLAAYFAEQISARSMAFAMIGVLTIFAPVAFFLLGRDTAKREDSSRVSDRT